MFTPANDLSSVQKVIMKDSAVLELMGLAGKPPIEIAKRIICKSRSSNLVNGKLICIYFRPSRKLRNQAFLEEVIQIDCHVPADEDYKAYQIQERIKSLIHRRSVNKRYLYFDGQLGELPAMDGFFCVGSRFVFNRTI
ncbi:MAG: hypothetical protein N2376_07405 [Clostridia bacterium]|nr:hypothetical protein [Clostridia bacterium]